MPKHVLILGCGRSGTSIFGELFDHLDSYTYLSELPYEQLYTLDYEMPYAIKVPRESQQIAPDKGLSIPLADLPNTLPQPYQIFWLVRHPLDSICSLRVGISQNWGHHPRPHDWREWLDKPLLDRCAHHWNYLNTFGYQAVADRAVVCHFERMLEDPLGFAQEIGRGVEWDWRKEAKNLNAWARRVQNTNNADFVEARTSQAYSRPDHTVRMGRWKENLRQEEVDALIPQVASCAEQFGYKLG